MIFEIKNIFFIKKNYNKILYFSINFFILIQGNKKKFYIMIYII
jgi:hypothetical protein